MLTSSERQTLLTTWNETTTDYPKNSLVHRQFELQVDRTPHATALVSGEREMTYDELNRRANQLAHHLRSLGVGTETSVAVGLERSFEMIIAMLGVLYLGLFPGRVINALQTRIESQMFTKQLSRR